VVQQALGQIVFRFVFVSDDLVDLFVHEIRMAVRWILVRLDIARVVFEVFVLQVRSLRPFPRSAWLIQGLRNF
jgi:hypothetical protein